MNGNDERSTVPVDADKLIGSQGNNVASSRSTIKIDSLCIKLGIEKPKDDAPKCRHFSIRGYVAGMREKGGACNLLSFTELPPMDIPNFRYWRCQRCLQSIAAENASNETPLPSVRGQCLVKPSARSHPPQHADRRPFGEGTSGLRTDDDNGSICVALGADRIRMSQEIPAKKVFQEPTKPCTINPEAGAPKRKESNKLRDHEDPQKRSIVNENITSPVSQPIECCQQNDSQNGNPRRKAPKVCLLKKLLCEDTEMQQQKNETSSPLATSSQIKRKMLHDHEHGNDNDREPADSKKAKAFKGNSVAKNNVVELSSNSNGIIPNTRGFYKVNNMYEGIPSSYPEYLSMIRPSSPFSTSENVIMRNPAATFFQQDQVSSFTMFDPLTHSQKQPTKGISISDSGTQRPYDSRYHPYSGMRPGVQNPSGSSFSNVFQTSQNVKLTSSHGQQVYHKPQEEKSRGTSLASVSHGCRPEDSYVLRLPWHGSEEGNKLANTVFEPRVSKTCTINRNPADFSTPGPANTYMIGAEDLIFKGEICFKGKSASEDVHGPKKLKKIMKPTS